MSRKKKNYFSKNVLLVDLILAYSFVFMFPEKKSIFYYTVTVPLKLYTACPTK
jgi:hypothetical protein